MKLVNSKKRPSPSAVDQGDDTWLVMDDSDALSVGASELTSVDAVNAAPLRYDLDPDHPLYGTRALRNVPSGCGDILVDKDGKVLHAGDIIAIEEPAPIDFGPR